MVNKHGASMRDFFSTNMAVQIFYKMVLAFVFKNYENTKAHIDWPDPENHCFLYKKPCPTTKHLFASHWFLYKIHTSGACATPVL